MGKKLKAVYGKIAPVVTKISVVGLVLSLLVLLATVILKNTLTDPWHIFYVAITERVALIAAIVFAVLWVLFDFCKLWSRIKEALRKAIVSLKRQPSVIPLVMMLVTFVLFSFNLTDVSNTTAKIQGSGMGLAEFSIMLFSLLCMVCMLNAFPRRKKANIPMIVLMFVMFAIIVYADIHYCNAIIRALYRSENPVKQEEYIVATYNMLNIHKVMVIVSAALVALLPVYSKLLRMIKTSVDVEDNGAMGTIEIND